MSSADKVIKILNLSSTKYIKKDTKLFIRNNLLILKKLTTDKKHHKCINRIIKLVMASTKKFSGDDRTNYDKLKTNVIKIINTHKKQFNKKTNKNNINDKLTVDKIQSENEEQTENNINYNLTVDEIQTENEEQFLDAKIRQYKKFNKTHPMVGISWIESTQSYQIQYENIKTSYKNLNDACNKIIALPHKNLTEFRMSKIKKSIIQNGDNILIKYTYKKESYYDIQHILYYLGCGQKSSSTKYNKFKNKIRGYIWNPNKFKGYIRKELINLKTIKKLIDGVRAYRVLTLTKLLGIVTIDYKFIKKETSTCHKILTVFKNENIKPQYSVKPYLVDLYFPDYDLVIECDEHNHKDRGAIYEKKRQNHIENKLGATFIRFNPDDPDFDILNVISDIHYYMKKYDK